MHLDNMIIGSDRKTFEVLGNSYFARDKRNIYWVGNRLINIDIDTFILLGEPGRFTQHAKDKYKVYRTFITLEDADPKTFKLVENSFYGKDKNHVYYLEKKILGCDSNSFKILDKTKDLSCDKNNIFFRENIIKNTDPLTFKFIDNSLINDYHLLENAKINLCNLFKIPEEEIERIKNLEHWDYAFGMDKYNIFFGGKLLGKKSAEVDRILVNKIYVNQTLICGLADNDLASKYSIFRP
jgi:hypothetical protein